MVRGTSNDEKNGPGLLPTAFISHFSDEYSIYLENRVRHKESCDGQRREQSYLYTGQIFTCSGINFDFVSLVYEQRNAYGSTSLNGSRFGSTLCGISLEAWLSLGDLKFYKQRRFDCEYISVLGTYFNHFVFFYKFQSISDGLFVQSDLLIVFYVHEVE